MARVRAPSGLSFESWPPDAGALEDRLIPPGARADSALCAAVAAAVSCLVGVVGTYLFSSSRSARISRGIVPQTRASVTFGRRARSGLAVARVFLPGRGRRVPVLVFWLSAIQHGYSGAARSCLAGAAQAPRGHAWRARHRRREAMPGLRCTTRSGEAAAGRSQLRERLVRQPLMFFESVCMSSMPPGSEV